MIIKQIGISSNTKTPSEDTKWFEQKQKKKQNKKKNRVLGLFNNFDKKQVLKEASPKICEISFYIKFM